MYRPCFLINPCYKFDFLHNISHCSIHFFIQLLNSNNQQCNIVWVLKILYSNFNKKFAGLPDQNEVHGI